MKYYYIKSNGSQSGPFRLIELQAENITPQTLVRMEGNDKVVTASEWPELSKIISCCDQEDDHGTPDLPSGIFTLADKCLVAVALTLMSALIVYIILNRQLISA